MANQIEKAYLNKADFVNQNSRYANSQILYYGDRRQITFETYKRKQYFPSANDKTYTITKATEYRPDLVSFKYYGDVDFWWKILEVNKMKDIWDFKLGTNIILPGTFT